MKIFDRSKAVFGVISIMMAIAVFSFGCGINDAVSDQEDEIGDAVIEQVDEDDGSEQESSESAESDTVEEGSDRDLSDGFPGTVPINDEAEINESSKDTGGGSETYYVNMSFEGAIGQLSDWYESELEKNWQIDSVSEGEYDGWADFYVDAQNDKYYLSVYLFQDDGDDIVSIDINIERKDGAEEIEEAEEAIEEEQEEGSDAVAAVTYSGELENAEIAFVCASVGSAWNINEHFPGLNIAVYDEYQFDKGDMIRDLLAGSGPDIMIIKECAAYFPPEEEGTSMEAYRELIRGWVSLCRNKGVIPVLTTVVPIDPNNAGNRSGQLESILEFNDWIHDYCRNENISILDLEAAVRASDKNRVLDPVYDSGDGLHLNDSAYSQRLDHILIPALEQALGSGQ